MDGVFVEDHSVCGGERVGHCLCFVGSLRDSVCKGGGYGSESDDIVVDFVCVLRFVVFSVAIYGFCGRLISTGDNINILVISGDAATICHRRGGTLMHTCLERTIQYVGET